MTNNNEQDDFVKGDPRDYRRELWIGVAVATAGASNCNRTSAIAQYADAALKAFDERFPSK